MDEKITEAKERVDAIYADLIEAARDALGELTRPVDLIVAEIARKGISLLSNSELWDFQMRLSIEAYKLGNWKEQSALKAACASALYDEAKAQAFNGAIGAQEAKKQQALLDTTSQKAVTMLYDTIESLLKTKCDEAHRLVNTIQNIQISRAAEAKLSSSPRSEADNMQALDSQESF